MICGSADMQFWNFWVFGETDQVMEDCLVTIDQSITDEVST